MLLCRAKVGERFEVSGHAEILEPKDAARNFGVVISYYSPQVYWECYFLAAGAKSSYRGRAEVCCSVHHNPHARPAKVERSDDFDVQVYDGQVATRVGAEVQREQAPVVIKLDHDAPSAATPFGVGASRGWFTDPPVAVRFTNLKLRKMNASPVQVKLPEPE